MKRGVYLAILGVVVLGGVIVTTGGAQVFPVRLDEHEPQPAAPTPPSLVLADGGIEFSDGSVQTASAENPAGPCFDTALRFVDCGNGTVTDTVSGLIYLENANCFGLQDWPTANQSAAALADGQCGLTDGSRAGDWRLQTSEEWEGILDSSFECIDPFPGPGIVGNGSPTTGCYNANGWASDVVGVGGFYWSSTTISSNTTLVGSAVLPAGQVFSAVKTSSNYVWPVRGAP